MHMYIPYLILLCIAWRTSYMNFLSDRSRKQQNRTPCEQAAIDTREQLALAHLHTVLRTMPTLKGILYRVVVAVLQLCGTTFVECRHSHHQYHRHVRKRQTSLRTIATTFHGLENTIATGKKLHIDDLSMDQAGEKRYMAVHESVIEHSRGFFFITHRKKLDTPPQ